MAKKLQTLIQNIVGDGARAAKFFMEIGSIPGLESSTNQNARVLAVMCKAASFPGKTLTTIPFDYKGRAILIPSHVKYEQTFELTFYLDEDHSARIIFSDWMQGFDMSYESYYEGTHSSNSNTSGINNGSILTESIRNKYGNNDFGKMTTVKVSQLDFDNETKTAEYIFHNCYPSQLSPVTVDASQTGAILEYTVTFTYSHMLVYNPKDNSYPFSAINP